MITFFTTTEKFNFQFLNSLESWLKLSSVSEIVVYTSLTEGLEDYPSVLLRPYPVKPAEHTPPTVKELFLDCIERGDTDYYCYVNSDIIFLADFDEAFSLCLSKDLVKFQMIGRRHDWTSPVRLNVSLMSDEEIKTAVGKISLRHPGHADYFCFHKDIYSELEKINKFPPFLIARRSFDNWLAYAPRFLNFDNVDCTDKIYCIHHDEDLNSRKKDWSSKPGFDQQVEYNFTLYWEDPIPIDGSRCVIDGTNITL